MGIIMMVLLGLSLLLFLLSLFQKDPYKDLKEEDLICISAFNVPVDWSGNQQAHLLAINYFGI